MTHSNTIPKIFTKKAFLYLIDLKNKEYEDILKNKTSYYKKERLLKKNGVDYREIYKPAENFKFVLKKVNKRYLSLITFPNFIHCGPKAKSIVTAARGHEKFIHHLSVDIESFFDMVTKETVEKTLKDKGVSKAIIKMITDLAVEDNRIPQGFPTSPLLSAIATSYALKEFYIEFNREDIVISIYADDILISSNKESLITIAEEYIKNKFKIIGLELNDLKRETGKKGTKFLWLGLQIHPWICYPREKIVSLQQKIYRFKKLGVIPGDYKPKVLKKTNLKTQWKESMKGKVVFIKSVTNNKLVQKIEKNI